MLSRDGTSYSYNLMGFRNSKGKGKGEAISKERKAKKKPSAENGEGFSCF